MHPRLDIISTNARANGNAELIICLCNIFKGVNQAYCNLYWGCLKKSRKKKEQGVQLLGHYIDGVTGQNCQLFPNQPA